MKENSSYGLNTIRQKANNINYKVEKGFTHYRDVVYHDQFGNRHSGYMVYDLERAVYVQGCYDENFDFLWNLDDVIKFLKKEYEEIEIDW